MGGGNKQNAWKQSTSGPKAASVQETMKGINDSCRQRGGVYSKYSCKVVSWDDSSRTNGPGGLSCWGANITDTYLTAKDGRKLFTLRSDNWNEKLGSVNTDQVALVAGNHVEGGMLMPVTLRSFLESMPQYASHVSSSIGSMDSPALDQQCSIRFQTTFLPVEVGASGRGALEFTTESYNYNTQDNANPKNLLLLCTTQGVAVDQDGRGKKKLFHQSVHGGQVKTHWLEAEQSTHSVGTQQVESEAERQDALARGKATSSVIGVPAMGTRFNVLMTIQVPLAQPQRAARNNSWGGGNAWGSSSNAMYECDDGFSNFSAFGGGGAMYKATNGAFNCPAAPQSYSFGGGQPRNMERKKCKGGRGGRGVSNAARVSQGSESGVSRGLTVRNPTRHQSQRITVTVVMYYTVTGGTPSAEDVIAAIDDMEQLYRSCQVTGNRSQSIFNFANNTPLGTPITPAPLPSQVFNPSVFPGQQQQQPPYTPPSFTSPPVSSSPSPPFGAITPAPFNDQMIESVHNAALDSLNAGTPQQCVNAFTQFQEANAMHTSAHGVPHAVAMYNMACTLSVLARDAPLYAPVVLHTHPGSNMDMCVNQLLDAALVWLRMSVCAGYNDVDHMRSDPDLSLLMTRRTYHCANAFTLASNF